MKPQPKLISTKAEIVLMHITPEYAKYLLQMNTGNFRRCNPNKVDEYTEQMRRGEWDTTGDTIKITDGVLIDGQHRLEAIVKSGKAQTIAIAWNIAKASVHIDRGQTRTPQQWITHQGIPNANQVAAAARLILQHNANQWALKSWSSARNKLTDQQLVDFVAKENNRLQACLQMTAGCSRLIPSSMGTAICYLATDWKGIGYPDKNELLAWFWGVMKTGIGEEGDAPLLLREKMIADSTVKTRRMDRDYRRWIATKAWNACALGEPINSLRLIIQGPRKTPLPDRVDVSPY